MLKITFHLKIKENTHIIILSDKSTKNNAFHVISILLCGYLLDIYVYVCTIVMKAEKLMKITLGSVDVGNFSNL